MKKQASTRERKIMYRKQCIYTFKIKITRRNQTNKKTCENFAATSFVHFSFKLQPKQKQILNTHIHFQRKAPTARKLKKKKTRTEITKKKHVDWNDFWEKGLDEKRKRKKENKVNAKANFHVEQ